jgi:outer membrane protein OmpA-like peptidoglycan-associated protein
MALMMALIAVPAGAQDAGSVDLGIFSQVGGFDTKTGLEDAIWGVGGSLGYFFVDNFALEAASGLSWTEDTAPRTASGKWTPIRGRVVYAHPVRERVRTLLGLGAVYNRYTGVISGNDIGYTGLAGLKLYISDSWAFRSDVSFDYVPSPFNEGAVVGGKTVSSLTNAIITMGFSVNLGGTPRDEDADGVPDRDDSCLGTVMGVRVDAMGCRVDTDGDGVFDEADSCASTPSGVRVDARGCRVDTDGDGVFDEADACANTPSGVRVDARGCRVDTDGDGVFDESDACANTPSGVRVDARGCRVDADGDGVFDEVDQCANSPRGSQVNDRGCPVLFEENTTALVLEGVTFETSSATLTAEARTVLDRVAIALNGNPDVRVRVVGHTDASGNRASNVRLSQARAESVAAYLTSKGVVAGRMEATGVGPDRPIADNATAAGRQMNRRVELERIN